MVLIKELKGNYFYYNMRKFKLEGSLLRTINSLKGFNKKKIYDCIDLLYEHNIRLIKFRYIEPDEFEFNYLTKLFFKKYFSNKIPYKSNLKRKELINPVVMDLALNYKAFRHYKGYPVRGQKTRNNAKNSNKLNMGLRVFKLKQARQTYGNLSVLELNVANAAEYINLVYYCNFYDAWYSANEGFSNKKVKDNQVRVDLYSMANNQVMYPDKFNTLTKKQKQSFKKSHFSLGFEPGFTKRLLQDLLRSRMDSRFKSKIGNMLLFRKNDGEKKNRKKPKKKTDIKAKKLAHIKKKKSKKSVWD